MVDLFTVEQQAKEIATQNAADLCEALFAAEVATLRSETATAIQQAQHTRAELLTALHEHAATQMQGDTSRALQQRTTIIKSYRYHQDGVNGVR